MNSAAGPVVISEQQIQRRVAEMGTAISADYKDRGLTVIGVLKGSFVFIADLIREIDASIPVEVEFMTVSSYGNGMESSGDLKIGKDLEVPLTGRDVLLVEDIVDTGLTVAAVRDLLAFRGAHSIRIAALIEKQCERKHQLHLDYVGFRIPDQFVVGYGLDYAQRYRNLKEIRALNAN